MEWLGPVLGALVASVVILFGYFQWRAASRARGCARYHAVRAEALDGLLASLRSLHIHSRRQAMPEEELDREKRRLNEYLVEHANALTAIDKARAREYLDSLSRIHREIREYPDEGAEDWVTRMSQVYGTGIAELLNVLAAVDDYLVAELRKSREGAGTSR
jgi:hypothetical protein